MTTVGELLKERDVLLNYICSIDKWREALSSYNNTAYKGDGRRYVDEARAAMERAFLEAKPIIDRQRR